MVKLCNIFKVYIVKIVRNQNLDNRLINQIGGIEMYV